MKKLLLICAVILGWAATSIAQVTSKEVVQVTTDITGASTCAVGKIYYNPTSLVNWERNNSGVCAKITAGGTPGDVAGPASSTDNAAARFDGTGGKTLQNSLLTIDDSGSPNIPSGQSYKINNVALAKGDIGLGSVDNTSDVNKPVSTAQQTALNLKENTANKDASGGYAGLTLFKINFRNAANTFTSFFTNANSAARTYTFQNRDGTIADDTDLALKAPLASPNFTGTVGGTNVIPLTVLAQIATNTIAGNASSGTANITSLPIGSCSTAGSALIWTTNTGFGCNTSIAANTATTATDTASKTGTGSTYATNTSPVFVTPNIGAASATTLSSGLVTLQANTSARALNITGRSDHFGDITFFKNDGTTVEGQIEGGTGTISLNDLGGNNIIQIVSGGWKLPPAGFANCTSLNTSSNTVGCTVSDARLKQNFRPFTRGLEAIAKLTPRTYQFRPNTQYFGGGRYHSTLVAQNVREAIPEAVSDIGNGTLQIDNATVVATLVNSVNQLRAQVASLQAQVKKLKARRR